MSWPGAVAVSGGGDSLALMHLLAGWARARKKPAPLVLTVDHGLRKQSAGDAKQVARWAKALNLTCEILTAKGPKPKADLEAWARQARYALLGAALRSHGLATLYLAHNRDEQAETFLLRLARGSGLDGLSAMQPRAPYPLPGFEGLTLARPLLGVSRRELRDYLTSQDQPWLEDPMNSETRFARARIRALLPALEQAGVTSQRIAEACAHLSRARAALESATRALLQKASATRGEVLLLDAKSLAAAPREIGLRALADLLQAVGGQGYRPRFEALERLYARASSKSGFGGGVTLHGCRIGPASARHREFGPDTLVITKESSPRAASKAPRKGK